MLFTSLLLNLFNLLWVEGCGLLNKAAFVHHVDDDKTISQVLYKLHCVLIDIKRPAE